MRTRARKQFQWAPMLLSLILCMIDAPPKVFSTVIQKDGTFQAVDRL